MKEYEKIETVFVRDDKTKKLNEEVYRNETVEFLKDVDWEFTEKIDGCLTSKSKLLQTNGEYITIKDVVENNKNVEIYGFKDGKICPTKVIAVHNNGITDNWIYLKVSRRDVGNKGNYYSSIKLTPNHKVFANGKYIRADELKVGDKVTYLYNKSELNYIQKQILIGLMLGDGCLYNRAITFSHKKEHESYIDWILKCLGSIAGNKQEDKKSGYGTTMCIARTISHYAIQNEFGKWIIEGKKHIPQDLMLSPVSLAIFYMDDGSLMHNEGQEDRIVLCMNDFDELSVKIFQKRLKELFGIESILFENKGKCLRLNAENTYIFQTIICPYITECMQYKLSDQFKGKSIDIEKRNMINMFDISKEQEILSIEKVTEVHTRYDLTTETNNYFANNILVHNCNIRIFWDGHKVSYFGRTDKAQIPSQLMNRLIELFGGNVNEEIFEQKFGDTPVMLIGEGYGAKIQKGGGNYRQDNDFILFDVYINGKYLSRENVKGIANYFNIDVVPTIMIGKLQEGIDFVKTKPKSKIGTADMEGLVARPLKELYDSNGKRIIVKIKVCDFENKEDL